MRALSRFIFDPYDDVDGRVLRSFLPSMGSVPEIIKTAARLSPEDIRTTGDDNFALVMLDNGKKLKKYATVDEGNTALSVAYLLKQAHLLPKDAVKIAANNLINASKYYGLEVPYELKIAASTGTSPVSGKSQKPYMNNVVDKANFPPKGLPTHSALHAVLGQHDGATADVDTRTNLGGTQGTNFVQVPKLTEKEHSDAISPGEKTASASLEFLAGDAPIAEANGNRAYTRRQMTRESPYVDVSSWDPSASSYEDHTPPDNTLLDGKYPVDSYDQVKTASVYFAENSKQLHPRDRHEYCVKLASRMSELRMEVPEEISRYGSTEYAADVDSLVEHRRGLISEEFVPALDMLLEKRAQVSPECFASALEEFDKLSGLRWVWGSTVADPWATTFGQSIEKWAEEQWSYDENGCRITLEELNNLAQNGYELVKKSFGEDFAKQFSKSPKVFFEALPSPNKLILARLAMDRHAGTGTE